MWALSVSVADLAGLSLNWSEIPLTGFHTMLYSRLSKRSETDLIPPVKYFSRPFKGGTSFVDHLCFLCLVFLMLSRLFIAAVWSPAGKGLSSWLLLVMFIVFLLLPMWYPGSEVVLDCIVF